MKHKKRKILLLIILFILIAILIFLGIKVLKIIDINKGEKFIAKPANLKFESRIEKYNTFDEGNFYKFGWLQIQGTDIDVPILDITSAPKVDDLEYSYSWMSQNYITGQNRPVFLGHNILNVSNEPMLPNDSLQNFEELMAFTYYGFAKDNLYIQYTVDDKDEIYLIYAIGFYDYGYDSSESINSKEKTNEYIKKAKKNSIYDYDIDVNGDDEIITVKTCTRYFGSSHNQQFIIDARKLRKDEIPMIYQVKTNKNFEKLNLQKEKM